MPKSAKIIIAGVTALVLLAAAGGTVGYLLSSKVFFIINKHLVSIWKKGPGYIDIKVSDQIMLYVDAIIIEKKRYVFLAEV